VRADDRVGTAETVREAGLPDYFSGRLSVVLEQNPKALLAPRVKVFFSAKSRLPLPQVVVDLSKPGIEDSRERGGNALSSSRGNTAGLEQSDNGTFPAQECRS
jgi:hypothetical protein